MITAYPRKEHHTGKEEEKLFQDHPLRMKLERYREGEIKYHRFS